MTSNQFPQLLIVIPSQAGIHGLLFQQPAFKRHWIPAFAGMTSWKIDRVRGVLLLIVIPAQAGIHCAFSAKSKWITRRILRLALRAIGFADVRSGLRRNVDGIFE